MVVTNFNATLRKEKYYGNRIAVLCNCTSHAIASHQKWSKNTSVKSPIMMSFKYDRGLKTGFGDRISVLLNVAAAAATVNAHVFVWWHEGRKERTHHADMSLAEVNM